MRLDIARQRCRGKDLPLNCDVLDPRSLDIVGDAKCCAVVFLLHANMCLADWQAAW